jgi:hypothetical protein
VLDPGTGVTTGAGDGVGAGSGDGDGVTPVRSKQAIAKSAARMSSEFATRVPFPRKPPKNVARQSRIKER